MGAVRMCHSTLEPSRSLCAAPSSTEQGNDPAWVSALGARARDGVTGTSETKAPSQTGPGGWGRNRGLNLGTHGGSRLGWGGCQQRGRPQPLCGMCCDVIPVVLETEGPPTQAHGHSQLGRQWGPVDPVPALGASPGSHPGVLGDWVSAQEVLKEKSSRSPFFGH